MNKKFFATCARRLEPILARELRDMGAADVVEGRGGVQFAGDLATLYRANLWLRTAVRVLCPILEAPVNSPEELYDAVQTIDWTRYMTPEHTLAVDCNVRDSNLTHSKYAALKVKDAICDQFVAKQGRRPSVDVECPMVALNLHVYRNEAVLSLDSSWESLHKRGYRPILTRAPLNEALAAGLILQTGWHGEVPLVDPMCGSGTLCIEAAWMALRRPPGLTRKHFGFMGWMDYNVELWASLRDEARRQVKRTLAHPILGYDVRGDAFRFAKDNARAAGIGHLLPFKVSDVHDFRPPPGPPGILICNPPYGERIGEEKELKVVYRALGEVFHEHCDGWTLFVFTGNPFLARQIGLKQSQAFNFYNGKIPCQLLRYDGNPKR
jgi:putative N6-adenine-specific DNA methylase